MAQNDTRAAGPRCIALLGPFQSGKTTLLEAILVRTGAISRLGTVEAGTTVGDSSQESRHHSMSVELSVATTNFMGDSYTFIDCPGSVEFIHDMRAVLPFIDAAVVVCEADEKKVPQLQLILRELEDLKIPHFLFLNKIDKADKRIRDTVSFLQPASRVPLLLRQIPIWSGDIITGFTDLALERAFVYKEHAPSEIIELAGDELNREKDARFSMLETLADHDDELMEQLLEDIPPPRDKIFDDLTKELRDGLVCPVLIGTATRTNGVLRLLKALRHEAPTVEKTIERLGLKAGSDPIAAVIKTFHTAHGGKMSVVRVLNGQVGDGTTFITPEREAGRVAGVFKLHGPGQREARARASRRDRRARQARACQYRRHADRRQAGLPAARPRHRLAAGARHRGLRQGAQGRRQARPGPHPPARRKIPRSRSFTIPRPMRWSCGVRARCICGWRPSGWPIVSACRSSPASRRSAIARPSRRASCSAGGTRSSPAATASSATWCSTSSRCRAAPASCSPRRSRAGWCRATTSRRWRRASSTRSSTARSASRSSTSRSS